VTQPACLHDLLWWFVAALMPAPPDCDTEGEEGNNKTDKKDEHVSERGSDYDYRQVILFGLLEQCMAVRDLHFSTITPAHDTLQHEKF
jgi:hypothetical protein